MKKIHTPKTITSTQWYKHKILVSIISAVSFGDHQINRRDITPLDQTKVEINGSQTKSNYVYAARAPRETKKKRKRNKK